MTRPLRLLVSEKPDSPAVRCQNCRHLIRHFDHIGWVDMTPAVKGGLYDFCITPSGAHVPEPRGGTRERKARPALATSTVGRRWAGR